MATRQQIVIIHTLKSAIGINDDQYREMLSGFGVDSSRFLADAQAKKLIGILQSLKSGKSSDKPAPRFQSQRYEHLAKREGAYATPKQLRMIEAMWRTTPAVRDTSIAALNNFIFRIVGISNIEWIWRDDVSKIVRAIKAISAGTKAGARKHAR